MEAQLAGTNIVPAGTALLGLNSLSRQYSAIDRERVSQAAIDLLNAQVGADDVVLVKASRAVGLERVAEALLTEVPEAPRETPQETSS